MRPGRPARASSLPRIYVIVLSASLLCALLLLLDLSSSPLHVLVAGVLFLNTVLVNVLNLTGWAGERWAGRRDDFRSPTVVIKD
jgi:hypothetical protein